MSLVSLLIDCIESDNADELLLLAASKGDLDIVKVILSHIRSLDYTKDRKSLLAHAVMSNNIELVSFLIYKGVNIAYNNQQAFRISAITGNVAMMKLLYMNGANPHEDLKKGEDSDPYSVFDYACMQTNKQVFVFLIEELQMTVSVEDALSMCVRCKNPIATSHLLQLVPHSQATLHKIALKCIYEDSFNVFVTLMNVGIQIDYKNYVIIKHAHLYRRKSFIDFLDSKGYTIYKCPDILDDRVREGSIERVCEVISKGANVAHTASRCLVIASWNGDCEMVSFLLNKGANLKVQGVESLMCAAQVGNIRILRILLERGVDIHSGDDEALLYAVKNGHLDVVKLLISKGASVECKDGAPLRYAVSLRRKDIVECLLENGANPVACNGESIRTARWNGYSDILYLLKRSKYYK
jgi:ankyrin repeat protein